MLFRKFSAANGYELNNLDNEALDAPVYTAMSSNANNEQYPDLESGQDFTSLPCDAFLVARRTENGIESTGDSFRHKNPMYQSAHVQLQSNVVNNEKEYGGNEKGNNSKEKTTFSQNKMKQISIIAQRTTGNIEQRNFRVCRFQ